MFSGQRLKEIREAQGMSQASVLSILEFHAPLILIGKMVRRNLIKRTYRFWPNFLV